MALTNIINFITADEDFVAGKERKLIILCKCRCINKSTATL